MERIIAILLAIVLVGGCGYLPEVESGAEYRRISAGEAQEMMESYDVLILDVRTWDEFDGGHIPNAVWLPYDEILEFTDAVIYDIARIILVYCQSGRRSEIAARALVALGYLRVYDFGGINSWTGEIVQ